jgi:hypothetical protein
MTTNIAIFVIPVKSVATEEFGLRGQPTSMRRHILSNVRETERGSASGRTKWVRAVGEPTPWRQEIEAAV